MHVGVLSPYPEEIAAAIERAGDTWAVFETIEAISEADWVVSYGHRHIIREPHLTRWQGRLINLHISFLPWNRGSDPNFWSWVDGTPKGVTIHLVDKGLDTGPILAQRELQLSGTLGTSYNQLRVGMAALFAEAWPAIRTGTVPAIPQTGRGSYHRSADKTASWARLPLGFETPVGHLASITTSTSAP
jgi:methionyl-tRNA formyltransferase